MQYPDAGLGRGRLPSRNAAGGPSPNPALRPSRRGGSADRSLRRLGDAGVVPGHHRRAPGGAHGRRPVRRVAHGPAGAARGAGARVRAADAVQRPRPDRRRPGPVHAAAERARVPDRRPDRLPVRRRPPAAGRERLQGGRRPHLAGALPPRHRGHGRPQRPAGDAGAAGTGRARPGRAAAAGAVRLHRRRGAAACTRSSAAPATRASPGSNWWSWPSGRWSCGTGWSQPAPCPAGWARGTPCGWRCATRCTATT